MRIRFTYLAVFVAFLLIDLYSFAFDQQVDLRVSGGTANADTYEQWSLIGNIYARYSINSEPNDQIKAVFALDANAGTDSSFLGVYRAFIKVRFNDYFRMTFGKAPITWGEGIYYNAGDILFDSSNTGIILSSLEIRDNSQWLMDMYFSLGRYSYFQIVAVFPTLNYYTTLFSNALNQIPGFPSYQQKTPTFSDSSAGWRLGGKMGPLALQVGGAYRGDKIWYTSYASLTSGIAGLMDMYLDTRISVGKGLMQHKDYKKTWEITGGLYYTTAVDAGMFSVRLETIFRPYQNWKAIKNPNIVSGGILQGDTSQIGLYNYYGNEIYFEIGGNVTSYLSIYARNVFSAIDVSDYISLMITYTPIDKLSIALNTGVQMGAKYDLFSFRKAGATNISFMVRYLYE